MNAELIITFRSIQDEIRRITKNPQARPSIYVSYENDGIGSIGEIRWSVSTYSGFSISVRAETPEACIDAFRGIAISADVRLKEARRLRQQADDLESQAMALGASAADLAKKD